MADRKVTFDIIARAAQFKREMDEAARKTENLNDRMSRLSGRFPLMKAAAAGLGPALLPVLATAAVSAAALGVALASSGAALGVFGAVAKTSMTQITEYVADTEAAQTAYTDAIAKSGAASKEAKAAHEELLRVNRSVPQATRDAANSYVALTRTWKEFVQANQPATFKVMQTGFAALRSAIPRLQPLFDVGAAAAQRMSLVLYRFVTGGGMDAVVRFLAARGAPALASFGRTLTSLGRGIANLAGQVGPGSGGVLAGIEGMAAAFQRWTATSGGFSRFLAYAQTNGPAVGQTLRDLATAAVHIGQAVTPLAPVSLALAGALARIIAAVPPGVLTALVAAFIAGSVAIRVVAAVTRVWAVAQTLLNVAMRANPIVLVVTLLVALGAALYMAYRKSETFRRIVNGAFAASLAVARALVSGVKTAFAWFTGLPGRASDWFGGMKDRAAVKMVELSRAVAALPGKITAALGNLGGLLLGAGGQIIQGLIDGIQSKIGDLQGKLSSVTNLIPDWKGPPEKDARLLRPAGASIMGGLLQGIDRGVSPLRAKLGAITSLIGGTGGPVRQGQVSASTWGGLMSQGWRGRAGDGMEALYAPARGGGGGQPLTVQLVVDGRVLQQVLLTLKRDNGGVRLGLA